MPSVDNRVVRMEFDNAQFEQKITQSMNSLKDLDKALKMQGASKGLSDISVAASKINVEPVHKAISSIADQFVSMKTVAIGALASLGGSVYSFAASTAQSFSGLGAGFSEYELNIGSVQTILANTQKFGTTLPQVTAALDDLNGYADLTIYNFGQMVKNIGLFTNAGIRIEDATSMIKGFSNAAAASGVSADGAASAAYQLSQAMSAGVVRLMDWKSLQNVGLGNKNMQQALTDIGGAMGTINDKGQTNQGVMKDFNHSLETGWLSADVMSTYLKAMAGDMSRAELAAKGLSKAQIDSLEQQAKTAFDAATKVRTFTQLIGVSKESFGSGWSETFRIVIGDFTEATDFISGVWNNAISGMIARTADSRNNMFKDWKKAGGRQDLMLGILFAFHALLSVMTTVRAAFRDVFPKRTGKQLADLTHTLAVFIAHLIPTKDVLDNLRRTLRGVFSIISIGWTVLKEVVKLFFAFGKVIGKAGGLPLLTMSANLGDMIYKFQQMLVKGGGIAKLFKGMSAGVIALGSALGGVVGKVADFFKKLIPDKKAGDLTKKDGPISKFITSVKSLSSASDKFSIIGEKISGFFQKVADSVKGFGDGLLNVGKSGGNALEDMVQRFRDFFGGIGDAFSSKGFGRILDGLKYGLFAGVLLLIRRFLKHGVKFDFTGGALGSIKEAFGALTKHLQTLQKKVKANMLIKIAVAVAILAGSMFLLASIPFQDLKNAGAAMALMFTALYGGMIALSKVTKEMDARKTIALGGSILLISASIFILAKSLEIISKIPGGEIGKGAAAVAGALLLISGAIKYMDGAELTKVGINMLLISAAIFVLAFAVERFASIDDKVLYKGGIAVGVALGAISLAVKKMGGSDIRGAGFNVLLISAAIIVLSYAVQKFADINTYDLIKGGVAVALALKFIADAVKKMGENDFKGIGRNLLFIAGALFIMSLAVEKMAGIDTFSLVKALIAMNFLMGAISRTANNMKGTGEAALALLAIAAALYIIATAVMILGNLPIGKLAQGMLAVALILLAIGLAALVLDKVGATESIGALGFALLFLAGAVLIFAAGAYLFARAFQIIGEAGPAALDNMRKAIIEFGSLLPDLAADFVEGFVGLLDALVAALPQIVGALVEIGTGIIEGFGALIEPLATVFRLIMDTVLGIIVEYYPKLIDVGLLLIMNLLRGIETAIPMITASVARMILRFLAELQIYVPQIVSAGTALLVSFINGITNAINQIGPAIGDLITAFILQLDIQTQRVIDAGVQLILDMIQGIVDAETKIVTALAAAIIGFFVSVGKTALDFSKAAFDLVIQFVNALAAVIDDRSPKLIEAFKNLGRAVMDGMKLGIVEGAQAIFGHIPFVGGKIVDAFEKVLEVNSPSKVFIRMGGYLMAGMAKGINDGIPEVNQASEVAASSAMDTMQKALFASAALVTGIVDVNPVITPVLDLTQVQSEADRMATLLNQPSAFKPTVSLQAASSIAATKTATTEPVSTSQNGSGNLVFNQVNNSPTQLTTADIYKNTRNQISFAKEELGI